MERTHHLAELASLVAALRAQGRTARLVVRNVDRLGVVHLYFGNGQLLHVEGHVGTATQALRDLASWSHGAVRIDAAAGPPAGPAAAESLDVALSQAIAELEARGVVRPAPPSITSTAARPFFASGSMPDGSSVPSMPSVPSSRGTASAPPRRPALADQPAGAAGLPPLAGSQAMPGRDVQLGPRGTQLQAAPSALSEPQWHLLALAVRQIVEQVSQLLGVPVADGLIRRALAQGARHDAVLAGLELDLTGWLRTREPGFIARFEQDSVVEAIAELITRFENECATLVGEQRAHELIASAAMPMRASLEQIGLTIKTQ